MLSQEEALARLIAKAQAIEEFDYLPLGEAQHRILAEHCVANIDVPPADNSAMDGYACRIESVVEAGLRLPVSQTVAAGKPPEPLIETTAARIFTGAEIPPGANTVILQEDCERDGEVIVTRRAVRPGDHIRTRGQDIQAGSRVASRGDYLGPALLGVLASVGIDRVRVVRRPRIALLNTGSELIAPGRPLAPGQIYNSNRYTINALLAQIGCEVENHAAVADNLATTQRALQAATQEADLVITSGGVSVGDEDHVRKALERLGSIDFYKIRLKPGKPLAFGHIDANQRRVPVLGLPGNPVSAFVTFLLFAKPFIEALLGRSVQPPEAIDLPCDFSVNTTRTRPEYLRVKVKNSRLSLHHNQSSGVLSSLAWADGLALLPAGGPIGEGTPLAYYSLCELAGLRT